MTPEALKSPGGAAVVWKTLVFSGVGFALAIGALLGVVGFRTSGFVVTLVPWQILPMLAGFAHLYTVLAGLCLLLTARAKRRGGSARASERAVMTTLFTATL